MSDKIRDELTDQLFTAILSLKDKEQCYRFFEDICTISELKAMAQRHACWTKAVFMKLL
jgi:TrpR-related protein YerC/YecD